MSKEIKPYRYFDTPDGQDVVQKLWFVLKPTFYTAIGFSTCDVLLRSYPKTYSQLIGRYLYITGPMLAISSTFVIVTNLAASIRKKEDDVLNWAIGGYAAGGIYGVWRKSTPTGLLVGTAFALIAMGKKLAVQNNYTLFPPFSPMHNGPLVGRYDYTLTKERPKNYTTEPQN